MTIAQIYEILDQTAPFSLAMDFDNVGLLVGDKNARVTGILTAMDITLPVIEEALERGMNLIVSHHPVIFHPLRSLTPEEPAYHLVKYGISAICAHTNLDIAAGGVNDVLANRLELQEPQTFEPENIARVGTLSRGMTPPEFAYFAKEKLDVPALRYSDGGRPIRIVAVCGGSCGDTLEAAVKYGCDAFVTGEVKHSARLYASQHGMTVIDVGHFYSENLIIPKITEMLQNALRDTDLTVMSAQQNVCPETTI